MGELVTGLDLRLPSAGAAELEIAGISHDSRAVAAGELFVAIRGARRDGRAFVAQAVERGAVAVAGIGPPPSSIAVPWVEARDPRAVLAPLAARLYGYPDRELIMTGVTGTNGKSTTVWLLQSILEAAGVPTGQIGTVESRFRDVPLASARTTPEAPELYRFLRQARDRGAEAAVMEVSSHSLVLGRVAELRFDVAAFTNLSRDHLDFHASMEEYFGAKRRLFAQLKAGGRAVVNADDRWGRRLASELDEPVTFGRQGAVRPLAVECSADGTRARLQTPRGELELRSRLLGGYNVDNLMAAVGAAEVLGVPHWAVQEGVAALPGVPGRMERVEAGQPFPVFVDYAHTDDALRRLYRSVKEITGGARILGVFGVQGERDRGKRPLMGRAAGEVADLVILTTDNPRSEDPRDIMEALAAGVRAAGRAEPRLVEDRAEALREAVARAGPGWVVLVTGKGNEEGQEIAGVTHPHSDREVLEAALSERWGGTPGRDVVPAGERHRP